MCDGGKADKPECVTTCKAELDFYSTINHEIDIEIPTNSPQLSWEKGMTWNTMNCNTWVNDIDNYKHDTGAYYTQVAAKNENGSFISAKPEISDNKDYHWYTIDWQLPNNDYTKGYVKFYFDDPFDQTGKTKDHLQFEVAAGTLVRLLGKHPSTLRFLYRAKLYCQVEIYEPNQEHSALRNDQYMSAHDHA
jgi:hypothetical protein